MSEGIFGGNCWVNWVLSGLLDVGFSLGVFSTLHSLISQPFPLLVSLGFGVGFSGSGDAGEALGWNFGCWVFLGSLHFFHFGSLTSQLVYCGCCCLGCCLAVCWQCEKHGGCWERRHGCWQGQGGRGGGRSMGGCQVWRSWVVVRRFENGGKVLGGGWLLFVVCVCRREEEEEGNGEEEQVGVDTPF